MPEYIERESLLEKAKELSGGSFSTPLIISAIEDAPKVDVVEVVRCKECKSCDLINRQKAEVERLEEDKEQLKADIEMFTDIGKMYSELKAEAIKEFAERLKKEKFTEQFCGQKYDLIHSWIDTLKKEMVGDG